MKLKRRLGIGPILTRDKDYGEGVIAKWDIYVCPRCNNTDRLRFFKCSKCNKKVYFWKDEREYERNR